MADLIKLVKTYRLTDALDQRLRLGDSIFRLIEPKLRAFVFGSVTPNAAPDVLQEVLKAIAFSLRSFAGGTESEFWAWCYRIARNKRADHFRRSAVDRLQPMGADEMRQILDANAISSVRTEGVAHDLGYAMKLLSSAKPECHGLLWSYYVQDIGYAEIADEMGMTYDGVRMKIGRCLESARELLS